MTTHVAPIRRIGKLAAADQDDIDREFERIARAVYEGRLQDGDLDDQLTEFVADSLLKGVFKGFGNDFEGIDYDTPDYNLLAHLEKNVYHFSTAKNYNQLVELNKAIVGDNGRVRSFDEFKAAAAQIHEKYLDNWLRAEYNQAIGSSQMAARWVTIQEDKDAFPYLRYDTAGDDRVRPQHARLDGVVKHIDDPFWDAWYPPNGWNCRCDVQQVSEGKETPDSNIEYPDNTPQMFKVNVGKQGVVYPPGHPYFDIPDEADEKQVNRKAWEILSRQSAAYHRVQTFRNGGTLELHPLADKTDLPYNLKMGTEMARKGRNVRIRPHSRLLGVKNPEVEVNGLVGDLKETKGAGTASSIQGLIRKAAKQDAQVAILHLTHPDLTIERLKKGIHSALGNPDWNKTIQKVMLMYEDFRIVEIERAAVESYKFVEWLLKP